MFAHPTGFFISSQRPSDKHKPTKSFRNMPARRPMINIRENKRELAAFFYLLFLTNRVWDLRVEGEKKILIFKTSLTWNVFLENPHRCWRKSEKFSFLSLASNHFLNSCDVVLSSVDFSMRLGRKSGKEKIRNKLSFVQIIFPSQTRILETFRDFKFIFSCCCFLSHILTPSKLQLSNSHQSGNFWY